MKSYIFFNISSVCCQRILHLQKMVALATLLSFFYTMGHAAIGISEIKNPSTATSQDGKITVTATGTAGPFTFKWQDNNTQSIRTNLGPGTYIALATIFDEDCTDNDEVCKGDKLGKIIAHELGHQFGLTHMWVRDDKPELGCVACYGIKHLCDSPQVKIMNLSFSIEATGFGNYHINLLRSRTQSPKF